MLRVPIEQLRDNLADYVELAAGGETVLVTDRQRVLAELRPPSADEGRASPEADGPVAALVRAVLATPPRLPRGTVANGRPVAKLSELLAELDADRAER